MSIETTCQQCGRRLRVADEHAARRARCPACGWIYTVGDRSDAGPGQRPRDGGQGPPHGGSSAAGSSSAADALRPPAEFTAESEDLPPAHDAPQAGPDEYGAKTWASNVAGGAGHPVRSATGGSPFSDARSNTWEMRIPDGQIFGPVEYAELHEWFREGRIGTSCEVRPSHSGPWRPAGQLFPNLRNRWWSPQPGGSNSLDPSNPYAASSVPRPHLATDRSGLVMTLAILGWGLCILMGPCSMIFSVLAWSLGQEDMRLMRSEQMDPSGFQTTQTAAIMGMIQTVLWLLLLLAGFVLLLTAL